jgi:hypothetical protein
VEGILMMEIQEVEEAPEEEDLPIMDSLPEDLEMDILIEEYCQGDTAVEATNRKRKEIN